MCSAIGVRTDEAKETTKARRRQIYIPSTTARPRRPNSSYPRSPKFRYMGPTAAASAREPLSKWSDTFQHMVEAWRQWLRDNSKPHRPRTFKSRNNLRPASAIIRMTLPTRERPKMSNRLPRTCTANSQLSSRQFDILFQINCWTPSSSHRPRLRAVLRRLPSSSG